MGNPNNFPYSGYDGEPIDFPADPHAEIEEDKFVVGLFRRPVEDSLEPLYVSDGGGLQVDMRKEL